MIALPAAAQVVLVLIVIGLIAIFVRPGRVPSPKDRPETCPLCGKSKHMRKARLLYRYPVCKKCYDAFARRRQLAFAIDMIIIWGVAMVLGGFPARGDPVAGEIILFITCFAFLMKDGVFGHSPGKAIVGVKVINEDTGKPIGVGGSFKRNLPILIPFMPLVISVQLCGGHRTGDAWSSSKVVWKKYASCPLFLSYASRPLFLSKASPEFVMTDELRQEEAEESLSRAIKLEVKGRIEEAISLYQQIISECPGTEPAKDAEISLNILLKKMQAR